MAIEIKIPALGESISEVTISSWIKKEGDYVEMDEILCEVETDKATQELHAETSGVLHIVATEGTTLSIGAVICTIDASGAPKAAAATPAPAAAEAPAATTTEVSNAINHATGHPSPAAAKILAEKGIAGSDVVGSGKDGRITKEDALQAKAPEKQAAPAPAAAPAASANTGDRSQRRERMSPLRRTVSRRLVAVKNETAMLTTFNEINMGPVMELRSKYKDKFKEKHSIGLGFMSFFTKACAIALKEWPAVNAMIDGDEMVFNDFVDISIAVSAPKGLVVPVIRNADQLSLAGIEKEVSALAKKARENKLSLEEMTGGTFTITNGGVFGSMLSTPIINAPQSAILGMHNIVERAIVINGEIVVRPVMYVALSYDHRIIDGRESVSFLFRVKELLEDPARMLLDV